VLEKIDRNHLLAVPRCAAIAATPSSGSTLVAAHFLFDVASIAFLSSDAFLLFSPRARALSLVGVCATSADQELKA